jgi:DNA polymerase
LSQIEARITAVLAGQLDLVEQFRNGEDVYSVFASKLFGFAVSKADPTERFVGKTCILGLGFGVAANTLYASLKLGDPNTTLNDCINYVNIYRATNDKIVDLWAKFNTEVIHAMVNGTKLDLGFGISTEFEAIVLPNGMKLRYPNLHQIEGERWKEWVYDYRGKETRIYGAKLVENLVQALARIIIAAAEMRLYDAGFRAAMQVHDELIFSVPDNLVGKFSLVLERVLTQPVPWMPELPVAAEVSHGDTYADAK